MSEQPIWSPDAARVADSNMAAFMNMMFSHTGVSYSNYDDLHRWSVEHPEQFWAVLEDFVEIRWQTPAQKVLTRGDRMPGARWFEGGELNFAENLLRFRDRRCALVFRDESGTRSELSYGELCTAVARTAGALRALGVVSGDRVAAYLPNHPQTVIAMLATASVGAIWSSCSPDFGARAALDRLGQINPKVLFAVDGYHYGGKREECLSRVAEISTQLKSLECVVVVPFLDDAPDISNVAQACLLEDWLSDECELHFERLPFAHPLYILFSSGTTGKPKCILHGAGGTLVQHLKELVLHTDLKREDSLFFFTTCGWMMWNWLVSGLATGAKIVLYDGSPFHPGPEVLWDLAAQEQVSIFGAGARYYASLEKSAYRPCEHQQLDALRTVLSTGSPLAPHSYDFIYAAVKDDVQLASISGGTDLISCFALGNPVLPVYRGELQSPGLGMAVDVYNDSGRSAGFQNKGELVCKRPFPSMPLRFWDDSQNRRYLETYFERFDGVWAHGDFAELTSNGGLVIHGRSDAVLNPGGVRIGSAEIYSVVEGIDAVIDSLVIGQQWDGDTRIVLFVVLRAGAVLDDALRSDIKTKIRTQASPRHVPALVIAVPDIPRTRSGKIAELAVRDTVHGRAISNLGAFANPEALEHFVAIPELCD